MCEIGSFAPTPDDRMGLAHNSEQRRATMTTATSTVRPRTPWVLSNGLPGLEPGDRMDQPTFHSRYKAMPAHIRAELIGGIVYMPSPVKTLHADVHAEVVAWLKVYQAVTPGVRAVDNATVILGADSEPQPDASLYLLDRGQTKPTEDGYLTGAPELVAEIALSSESYDLSAKHADYLRHGVQEYLVVLLRQQRVVWFVREGQAFVEMTAGLDGVFRSRFFKGLWLDAGALVRGETGRVHEVLREGVASVEHAEFVRALARP
jgi:Uma2 family endonuclease